jgi:hypothetical protein
MTDAHDPDLDAVDRAARAASRGLQDHVDRHLDPELALVTLPTSAPPRHHGRLVAAAAVAALFVGSVAVLGDGPEGDDRSRLELDEDGNELPPPVPGRLTPLGPNDGRDSIQLPIAVEPNVGLGDGQTVRVSGSGFVPGERVGIVQCAREAGGEVREQRAGIDGCNIGSVQYADADADGVAAGTFTVHRVLTTPATGTVDCAVEAERCIVAMGALNDYDRSGGFGVAFTGGGEPIDLPTVTVSPADGLSDGDVVVVEGEGFTPGPVLLSLCSIDPTGCWSTGQPIQLDEDELRDVGASEDEYGGSYGFVGLLADTDGRLRGEVPVWRFLPTMEAGSYIDCAVSACALRVSSERGGHAPAPVALGFTPGGPGPRPPAIAAEPTRDLAEGDQIVVRGAGFQPGAYYSISVCVAPPGATADVIGCASTDDGSEQVDEDGGFAQVFEVPDLGDVVGGMGDYPTTTTCGTPGDCGSPPPAADELCDGVHTECTLRVEAYSDGTSATAPQFPPAPVTITLRR